MGCGGLEGLKRGLGGVLWVGRVEERVGWGVVRWKSVGEDWKGGRVLGEVWGGGGSVR